MCFNTKHRVSFLSVKISLLLYDIETTHGHFKEMASIIDYQESLVIKKSKLQKTLINKI